MVLFADQVRLAGNGGGSAVEPEEVLVLRGDFVADLLEAVSFLVDQGGVLERPRGGVEVGWRFGPVLVMGAEPVGPLAGILAGEELC